jgi:hypothetical protein
MEFRPDSSDLDFGISSESPGLTRNTPASTRALVEGALLALESGRADLGAELLRHALRSWPGVEESAEERGGDQGWVGL